MKKNLFLSLIALCLLPAALAAQPEWQSQRKEQAGAARLRVALRNGGCPAQRQLRTVTLLYEPERYMEIPLGEEPRPPTEGFL